MSQFDLTTKIGGVFLEHPIFNASGAKCMTRHELEDLDRSHSSALVTKSATIAPREGNPSPRYVEDDLGSINSMGLPNHSLDFYLSYAKERGNEKPIFISVAGLSLEENITMLKTIEKSKLDVLVELNLSCPNIVGKPQTGYDYKRSKEVLGRAFAIFKGKLGIKLPPYFDLVHFDQMATVINQFPVSFVTCVNSIGNGLIIDPDSEATDHTIIPFGKGICGQVAVSNQNFVVPDVSAQDNYIACSITVKSEIVVPIFVNGENIGQIDIDSKTIDPFTDADERFLEFVCENIATIL